MKTKHFYLMHLILVLVLSCSLNGCRKGCQTKALGEMKCASGYISVADTRFIQNYFYWKYHQNELAVIRDIESYKEAFANQWDSMPLGYIDFSTKSIVGVSVYRDAGESITSQGCLCYNPETKKWKFSIEYSMSFQCKGSGIYSGQMFCCIIGPKIPVDAVVEFEVENINPL